MKSTEPVASAGLVCRRVVGVREIMEIATTQPVWAVLAGVLVILAIVSQLIPRARLAMRIALFFGVMAGFGYLQGWHQVLQTEARRASKGSGDLLGSRMWDWRRSSRDGDHSHVGARPGRVDRPGLHGAHPHRRGRFISGLVEQSGHLDECTGSRLDRGRDVAALPRSLRNPCQFSVASPCRSSPRIQSAISSPPGKCRTLFPRGRSPRGRSLGTARPRRALRPSLDTDAQARHTASPPPPLYPPRALNPIVFVIHKTRLNRHGDVCRPRHLR